MIPKDIAPLLANGKFKALGDDGNPSHTIKGYVAGNAQIGIFKFSKPHFIVMNEQGDTFPKPIDECVVFAKDLEDYEGEDMDLIEAISLGYWPGEDSDFKFDCLRRL